MNKIPFVAVQAALSKIEINDLRADEAREAKIAYLSLMGWGEVEYTFETINRMIVEETN